LKWTDQIQKNQVNLNLNKVKGVDQAMMKKLQEIALHNKLNRDLIQINKNKKIKRGQ
jgi:hypothetical protein